MANKTPKRIKESKPSISKVNRQITVGFVLVTITLVIIIAYFSLSRVVIYITPELYPLETSAELQILPEVTSTLTSSNILPGLVTSTILSSQKKFTPTEKTITENKAGGIVKIINNYSRNQTLVATTRLLSPQNFLYRTTETVVVPAGSSVTVNIIADQDGDNYELGPTNFTIPGLWEGLQDQIYAVAEQPIKKLSYSTKAITPQDLELAKEDLLNELEQKVKNEIIKSDDYFITNHISLISTSTSQPVGAEVDSYEMKITAKVDIIAFTKNDLENLAVNNLKNSLPDKQSYLNHDPASLHYELIDYNLTPPSATIKAFIQGTAVADILDDFNKKEILGYSEQDILEYFKNKFHTTNVQVNFFPSWVKSVPPLEDHVDIKIIK